jgi:hypothetical protein
VKSFASRVLHRYPPEKEGEDGQSRLPERLFHSSQEMANGGVTPSASEDIARQRHVHHLFVQSFCFFSGKVGDAAVTEPHGVDVGLDGLEDDRWLPQLEPHQVGAGMDDGSMHAVCPVPKFLHFPTGVGSADVLVVRLVVSSAD